MADKKSNLTVITRSENVSKSDAVGSNAKDTEDKYKQFYVGGDSLTDVSIALLEPPYAPSILRGLVENNESLPPCIAAMEVNIDGTGYDMVRRDGEELGEEDKEIVAGIEAFFDTIYPGTSLLSTRREGRRDLEEVGYAALEVIRNGSDEIVFLRRLDCDDIRLVRLDDAVEVAKKVTRGGRELTVNVKVRERRFCQLIGSEPVYFKEYGSSRDLDKTTGAWLGQKGKRLTADKRASEIIYSTCLRHSTSPYGVPRWVHNSPSVVGSRQAEELNLEFFNSGGIPPVLITITGGSLTEESKELLTNLLSGRAKTKLSAAVLEAFSEEGTLEKPGSVGMKVEKFGADSVSDSMFETYLDNNERRVRRSFRLPPLFVGKTEDFSFATAYASYLVAEEQVFGPERQEFDDLLNRTILMEPSLGGGQYLIRSRAMSLKNIESKIGAVELAKKEKAISNEELVNQLNELTGMEIVWNEEEGPTLEEMISQLAGAGEPPAPGPTDNPDALVNASTAPPTKKSDTDSEGPTEIDLIEMGSRVGRIVAADHPDEYEVGAVMKTMSDWNLTERQKTFIKLLAAKELVGDYADGGALKLIFAEQETGCAHG